jgi:DNA-directed RNA polymerase subunit RPC12/RpoP
MSLRLRCRSCQAAFVTSKDQVGQPVECPKCGASQVVPKPKPVAAESEPYVESGPALKRIKAPSPAAAPDKSSVFIAKKKKKGAAKDESEGSGKGLWVALGLVMALVVVGAVGWPAFRKWLNPRPDTDIEGTAYDYLMALKEGDETTINRIGVVTDPPSIRSFRDIKRDQKRDTATKGDFKPIARLHKSIEKKFEYDPKSGRFTLKDPLGAAAETLDTLHDAKTKAEQNKTYEKMASGDPNESMDATIEFAGVFTKLADGVLNPKNLIPTYKMLVQNAKPPLTGDELTLAMEYANHREAWDGLLKRPFPTLKSNGKFALYKVVVTAQVQDKLGSSGDPPVTVRLTLLNFKMDGIDTGWKVVAARRVIPGEADRPDDEEKPEPETSPEPAKPSPGDLAIPTGLNPDAIPTDIPPK